MKDNLSPEERLLKLIKGEKKTAKQAFLKAEAPAGQGNRIFRGKQRFLALPYLSAGSLYKLSLCLATVSFLFLLTSLVYPLFVPEAIRLNLPVLADKRGVDSNPRAEETPLEYYLQDIGGKDIFSNSASSSLSPGAISADADLTGFMNLVGIILGENPQAVIEDKRAQKTYYVKKGQFIGEFRVEDIQEGKIILNFRSRRYELFL